MFFWKNHLFYFPACKFVTDMIITKVSLNKKESNIGICGKWSYKYDDDDDEEKVLVKIRISPLSGPPRSY